MSGLDPCAARAEVFCDGQFVLLTDLFEQQFRLDRPAYANGTCGRRVRRAIRWLSQAVGRRATVKDLNTDAVLRMRELTDGELSSVQSAKIYNGICTLWAYAAALGLVKEFNPPDRLSSVQPPRPRQIKVDKRATKLRATLALSAVSEGSYMPAPPVMHLSDLLEHYFFVEFPLCSRRSYATQFRRAVSLYSESLGRPALTTDLNRETCQSFYIYSLSACDNGLSRTTRQWIGNRLRRLWAFAVRCGCVDCFDPPALPRYGSVQSVSPAPEGTVRWFFEVFYRPQIMLGCTRKTILEYRRVIKRLSDRLVREAELGELSNRFFAEHFEWMLDRGLMARTINRHRRILFAIMRMAHELGYLNELPRVRKLRETGTLADAWSPEEVGRIVAATSEIPEELRIGKICAADFFKALILMCWWTGLRIGSILSIRWRDVDLETGWVMVRAEHTKNRKPIRRRVGPDAIEALRAIHLPEQNLVFPSKYSGNFSKHFHKILHAAGIAPSPRRDLCHFHKLRRSAATSVAMAGGLNEAAAFLDHSNTSVTLRYVDQEKLPGADMTKLLPATAATVAPVLDPAIGQIQLAKAAAHLGRGDYVEACFMARIALELFLQSKIRGVKCKLPPKGTIGAMANVLASQRIIERSVQRQIFTIIKQFNRACHTGHIEPSIATAAVATTREMVLNSNTGGQ